MKECFLVLVARGREGIHAGHRSFSDSLSRPIKNSASKTHCSRVPDGFAFQPVVKTHSFVRYILLVLALAYSDFPDGAF